MHDGISSLYSFIDYSAPLDEPLIVTKYDETLYRLDCKFIRNGLSVIRLFLILVLFQISPGYSSAVHQIARSLTEILRDTLFDKRVLKSIIDFDTKGYGEKPHSTTRLKMYFILGNSDRYCIRLDFPHKGAESIHMNINEPVHKSSTGFPFRGKDYIRAFEICKSSECFDKLFYQYDDLYWFRSGYASEVKRIKKVDAELGEALEKFLFDRAHLVVTSKENMMAVSDFTENFEEAIVSCEGKSIYGNTSDDDGEFFQLMLFQDYILDETIKLRCYEMESKIGLSKECDENKLKKHEEELLSLFGEYIHTKFPSNAALGECVNQYVDLCGFINLNFLNRYTKQQP